MNKKLKKEFMELMKEIVEEDKGILQLLSKN